MLKKKILLSKERKIYFLDDRAQNVNAKGSTVFKEMSLAELASQFYSFTTDYHGKPQTFSVLVDLPLDYQAGKKYPVVILAPALGTRMTAFATIANGFKASGEVITVRMALPNSNDETSGDISKLELDSGLIRESLDYILSLGKWENGGGLQADLAKTGVILDKQKVGVIAPSMSSVLFLDVLANTNRYQDRFKSIILPSSIPVLKKTAHAKYPVDRNYDQDLREVVQLMVDSMREIIKESKGSLDWLLTRDFEAKLAEIEEWLRAEILKRVGAKRADLVSYMDQNINKNTFFAAVIPLETVVAQLSSLAPSSPPLRYDLDENIRNTKILAKANIPVTVIYAYDDELVEREDAWALAAESWNGVSGSPKYPVFWEGYQGTGHDWKDLEGFKASAYMTIRYTLRNLRQEKRQSKDLTGIPILSPAQIGIKYLMESIASAERYYQNAVNQRLAEGKPKPDRKLFQRFLNKMVSDEDIENILQEIFKTPREIKLFFELEREWSKVHGQNLLELVGYKRIIESFNNIILDNDTLRTNFLKVIGHDHNILASLMKLDIIKYIDINILNDLLDIIMSDYLVIGDILRDTDPLVLELIGKRRAQETFLQAKKLVPAYQLFLESEHKSNILNFQDAPITSKANYIRIYSLEERCLGGKLPSGGTMDRSGGTSSLLSTSWIRSNKEERMLQNKVTFLLDEMYNTKKTKKPFVIISSWSSGVWATGTIFLRLANESGIVINTGTDVSEIIRTLKEGSSITSNFLIAGYPPFISALLDLEDINWSDYNIHILHGGEAPIEGWEGKVRETLGNKPETKIYSAYGASDLEVGISSETELSQKLLKTMRNNEALRKALVKDERVPVFFGQYDPTNYHYEIIINEKGQRELVCTMANPTIVSPKIRYKVGDEGGILNYSELRESFKVAGMDFDQWLKENNLSVESLLKIPFIFTFGRSDGTISIDGANIYPQPIQELIATNQPFSEKIAKFGFRLKGDSRTQTRFHIILETRAGQTLSNQEMETLNQLILNRLIESNPDFAESYKNNLRATTPILEIYPLDSGKLPLKYIYIEKK